MNEENLRKQEESITKQEQMRKCEYRQSLLTLNALMVSSLLFGTINLGWSVEW